MLHGSAIKGKPRLGKEILPAFYVKLFQSKTITSSTILGLSMSFEGDKR